MGGPHLACSSPAASATPRRVSHTLFAFDSERVPSARGKRTAKRPPQPTSWPAPCSGTERRALPSGSWKSRPLHFFTPYPNDTWRQRNEPLIQGLDGMHMAGSSRLLQQWRLDTRQPGRQPSAKRWSFRQHPRSRWNDRRRSPHRPRKHHFEHRWRSRTCARYGRGYLK